MSTTDEASSKEEMTIKYVCGIDIGRQSCSGCIMRPDKSMVVEPTSFTNAKEGWQVWEEKLNQLNASPNQILIGLEATSQYGENLYHELEQHSYVLRLVYLRKTQPIHDRLDAMTIASVLLSGEAWIGYCSSSALQVLRAYPGASEIAAAGEEAIIQILEAPTQPSIHYERSDAQKLVELAHRSASSGRSSAGRSVSLRVFCDLLEHTKTNLAHLQAEIEQLLTNDPQVKGLKQIPVLGSKMTGNLPAKLENASRFAHANDLIANDGTDAESNEHAMKHHILQRTNFRRKN